MSLTSGTRLGAYEVMGLIGSGGMGEVYRARDTKLDRDVALKILPEELATDRERLGRFEREAKAASAISHPNIAHIYEIGESDGVHFIAMEHVEGETLATKVARQPLEVVDVLEIGTQVTDALDEAHSRGVVHRDLKPANLMLTARGLVKVLDFGLAKLSAPRGEAESEAPTVAGTQAGVVMGTAEYMSPEQALGRRVDGRSDLFSLGAVLYELLTGRRAFAGDSLADTLRRITSVQPESIARLNYDVPAELERIVCKCLQKDPNSRYQSARELLVDLRNLKRDSGRSSVTAAMQAHAAPRRFPGWGYVAAAVAALVLVAGALTLIPRDVPAIDAIAVLPFENASGDPDTEYLSDGITEAIISTLAKLPELRVISRSAAFQYKGQTIDAEAVGRGLDVDALVLGRITQRGDDLSVSAELVSTEDSGQIWGERYARQMTDLLEVQEDIATEVAEALRLELTSEQAQALASRSTIDPEAYREYLRGRYYWARRTVEGIQRSIGHFEEAIALDPAYALAYVGLADGHSIAALYDAVPAVDAYPRALAAAQRALEIEPALAEAHTSLGWIRLTFEWYLDEALREFDLAVELDPGYANGYHWAAVGHWVANQLDECIALSRQAVDLEPLSQLFNSTFGMCLATDGRYEEATDVLTRTLDLDPNYPLARGYLGLTHVLAGRYDEAIAEYQKIPGLEGRYSIGALGYAYAVAGRDADARELLVRLDRLASDQLVSPIERAQVYTGLGDFDQAFAELERAYRERTPELTFLQVEPMFRLLWSDPRFGDLLERMGYRQ